MPKITPSLLFNSESQDAAEFYVSIFPNSKVNAVSHYGENGPMPAGTVLAVDFSLDGQDYTAINSGATFNFSEAFSLRVNCSSQAEVDHYWDGLGAGGEEGQCGWLKDRFGVSWQIVPTDMGELLSDPDPKRAERAMQAMLGMRKLDVDAMRRAADQA